MYNNYKNKEKKLTKSILLIYHHSLYQNASTIMEHVYSFTKYSKYNIYKVNTEYGFPKNLSKIEFSAIILHYSPFPFAIPEKFKKYIEDCNRSLKIAFFQDEYQNCIQRFELINRLKIDIVYSLLDPIYFDEVYYKNTNVKEVFHTLTGYVCENLIEKTKLYAKDFGEREIDVGYRARPLAFHLGKGAQEKTDIAKNFLIHVKNKNLSTDINYEENSRIYGDKWNYFIGNCKFMLGVESGTSVFDLDGSVEQRVYQYLKGNPNSSFEEVYKSILIPYEDKINYRTISPRIFECAALKTCMILFKGHYQGILIPNRHYIVLEKDFSNISDVFNQMRDEKKVKNIIDNAYRDLILSGKYDYKLFINSFDSNLTNIEYFENEISENEIGRIIYKDFWLKKIIVKIKYVYLYLRYMYFPGRDYIKKIAYHIGFLNNI